MKTLVSCEVSRWTKCKHSIDGVCDREEVHLVLSYGRSTGYAEEFMCADREE